MRGLEGASGMSGGCRGRRVQIIAEGERDSRRRTGSGGRLLGEARARALMYSWAPGITWESPAVDCFILLYLPRTLSRAPRAPQPCPRPRLFSLVARHRPRPASRNRCCTYNPISRSQSACITRPVARRPPLEALRGCCGLLSRAPTLRRRAAVPCALHTGEEPLENGRSALKLCARKRQRGPLWAERGRPRVWPLLWSQAASR